MIEALINRVIKSEAQRALLMQLMRFGISGVGLTLFVTIGYATVAHHWHLDPNWAFTLVNAVAVIIGFWLHSLWTFKGHGGRDNLRLRTFQFVVVNAISYGINMALIWLIITYWHQHYWVAQIPMLIIAPSVSYILNRKWVFA